LKPPASRQFRTREVALTNTTPLSMTILMDSSSRHLPSQRPHHSTDQRPIELKDQRIRNSKNHLLSDLKSPASRQFRTWEVAPTRMVFDIDCTNQLQFPLSILLVAPIPVGQRPTGLKDHRRNDSENHLLKGLKRACKQIRLASLRLHQSIQLLDRDCIG
jgi:hypothetical protein